MTRLDHSASFYGECTPCVPKTLYEIQRNNTVSTDLWLKHLRVYLLDYKSTTSCASVKLPREMQSLVRGEMAKAVHVNAQCRSRGWAVWTQDFSWKNYTWALDTLDSQTGKGWINKFPLGTWHDHCSGNSPPTFHPQSKIISTIKLDSNFILPWTKPFLFLFVFSVSLYPVLFPGCHPHSSSRWYDPNTNPRVPCKPDSQECEPEC